MEGYRSYSEPHGYPEGRQPYPESPAAEPDYPEASGWYAHREPERYDERGHGEPDRYDEPRRDHPRPGPAEPLRVPGSRPSPGPGVGPVSSPPPGVGVGPVSGPSGSGGAPVSGPPPGAGPEISPPAQRRPVAAPGSPGPAGDSLYRSKRPALAALFWVPALVLEVPALLLLFDGLFGADNASASAVAAAVCLMIALPLLATGLYAVATGAVRAAGPNSIQAWLRPPVAYLTVGIALFVAAGLAA